MPVLLIHAYQTVYNNKLHTGEIITGTWNIILALGLSTRLKMWDKTRQVLRLCSVFTLGGIQLEWNVETQFLFGTFSTWSSATCEMPGIQPFDHWAKQGNWARPPSTCNCVPKCKKCGPHISPVHPPPLWNNFYKNGQLVHLRYVGTWSYK